MLGTQRLFTGPRPSPFSTSSGSSTGDRSAAKYRQVTPCPAFGIVSPRSLVAAAPSVAITMARLRRISPDASCTDRLSTLTTLVFS